MRKFTEMRLKAEEFFTWTLLALLILFVFVAAVLRWIGISIVWSVDIAQFLFTWLCFIGADLAYYNNKHMGVDLIKKHVPKSKQYIYRCILEIFVIVFLCLIFYFGIKLSIANRVRRFNSLNVSYSWTTIAASIGAFLMLLTAFGKLFHNIRVIQGKIPPDEEVAEVNAE